MVDCANLEVGEAREELNLIHCSISASHEGYLCTLCLGYEV